MKKNRDVLDIMLSGLENPHFLSGLENPSYFKRVFLSFLDAEHKSKEQQVLQQKQLSSPSLITSFRINNYSDDDKHNTQKTYNYSPDERKLLKKITCKSQHENCFSQISYCPGYEFDFLNFPHINKLPNGDLPVKAELVVSRLDLRQQIVFQIPEVTQ